MHFLKILNKLINSRLPLIISAPYFQYFYYIKSLQFKHIRNKKRPLKISFLMVSLDVWKYTSLVKILLGDKTFEVKVIICPFTSQGEKTCKANENSSIAYFKNKEIPYLVGREGSCKADKFLCESDVVFYFNPNKHTIEKYMYYNWLHKFTCFMIYSYRISSFYSYEFGDRIMSSCWRNYVESEYHLSLSKLHGKNSKNIRCAGYVKVEDAISAEKRGYSHRKVFLYAPHWTIAGAQGTGHDWSTFLDYWQLIFQFLVKNVDSSFLIFRPHPMLRSTLESERVWGPEKTQLFFTWLDQLSNVKVSYNEDYEELFRASDVLLHDSGGFMAEYLLQEKPCAFLVNSSFSLSKYNVAGHRALEAHYILENGDEVLSFMERILSEDILIKRNHKDVLAFLFSKKAPSSFIINDLKSSLWVN
jgi:hypothetical protein